MSHSLNQIGPALATSTPIVQRTALGTAANAAPATVAGPKAANPPADQVRLNQAVNPYEGVADHAERVVVDRWGQGPNDSIERILRNQGYTNQEIYSKRGKNPSLLERVAQVNGLRDPNLVRSGGRGLLVPSKHPKEEGPKTEAPKPTPSKPHVAKPHAPKVEPPKVDAPKTEAPKVEPPRVEAPKVEPPKVEPPKVEAPKTETPKAEPPKVEAPKTDGPAPEGTTPAAETKPKKHHSIFGWLHRHKKHEPTPTPQNPETPQPPVVPNPPVNTPANDSPQPVPAPNNTTPAAATPVTEEQATAVEIGLLVKGVNSGAFNRSEFQALNATANQFNEMRARYAKEGFSPEQTQQMAQIQHQYGQMYARFEADDKARISFKTSNPQDPNSQFRAQQNDEGGQLYDDYRAHRITEDSFMQSLIQQRQKASQLGVQ